VGDERRGVHFLGCTMLSEGERITRIAKFTVPMLNG